MADRLMRAKLARAAAGLNARSGFAGELPPLALLTDDLRLPDPLPAVRALPRGSLLIVRARDAVRRATLAEQLREPARARDLIFLIAADPALAARIGADGLHLPELRAQEAAHWRACHPRWLITCAAHSIRAIQRAQSAGADAALLSPVFVTQSHKGQTGLGAMRFRILARASTLPVYALGGIDAHTARHLSGAAAAGLAAIGALSI